MKVADTEEPRITTEAVSDWLAGSDFLYTLDAEGSSGITWTLKNGSLPDGITLDEYGRLSGISWEAGTYTVDDFVQKALTKIQTKTQDLTL